MGCWKGCVFRLKIVHTSDWHIGRYLFGYSLLKEQQYFLEQLEKLLLAEDVDLLLIAGDIFHTAIPSSDAVALIDRFFSHIVLDYGIQIALIAGNHDSVQRLESFHRLLEREGLWIQGSLSSEMKEISWEEDEKRIGVFLLPYFQPATVRELFPDYSPKSYDEALQLLMEQYDPRPERYDYSILVAHGFYLCVSPEQMERCDSELSVGGSDGMSIKRLPKFDYLALGHLHLPQRAGDVGFYSGAPLPYSISEAGYQKGVRLLETNPQGGISSTFIPIDSLHPLREITGTLEELLEKPSEDFLAVRLTDQEYQPDDLRRLRVAFPNLLEVRYQNILLHTVEGPTASVESSPQKIWQEFYRKSTGVEATITETAFFERALQEVSDETD